MVYLEKEDVLLRAHDDSSSALERFSKLSHQWVPYVYRRRDLEFVKRLTPDEAIDHLMAEGLTRAEARKLL